MMDFFIVNWGAPQRYQTYPDGSQRAAVLLCITKECQACAIAEWATVGFYFTPDGSFVKKQVVRFESGS